MPQQVIETSRKEKGKTGHFCKEGLLKNGGGQSPTTTDKRVCD